ncbi:leucyl-cystinyl aminopeptidase-like isoform X2 [Pleurodeles waltl]
MIENTMFEEEPDVVDLAKEPSLHPLEPDDVEYEPRSSRLLVRGLGEHDMDEDEEDYESSAKLLGLSFMNRSSGLRNSASGYTRQGQDGSCSLPSARTMVVSAVILVIIVSVVMVVYLLPTCTFTKEGCHKQNHTMELVYPIASNGQIFPWTKSRLPSAIKPLNYDLFLQPNLTTLTFTGSVSINLFVAKASKNIVLHSSGLTISKVALTSAPGGQWNTVPVLEYPSFDQIAVVLSEPLLEKHNYTLNIEYASNLSNTYYGFYKSKYKDENSNEKFLAATQFEPLAARKAFPCFDEPAFKSTFGIKILRDEKHIALSNMPKIATTKLSDGIAQDEFATSVKMSTYLVAFIVADMKCISNSTEQTMVSVYTVPQKINQVQYALETAVRLLQFYEKMFQVPYPLKKLDLVAIPDFQAGAMENWGLITFREAALLYNESTSSILDKRMVTAVIAHELAHQWFGNLVTMEWWNDLWLNEGFATYMEYYSLQKIFSDLQADDDFLDVRFKAMMKDTLNSTHPISSDVQTPQQIEEMFDALSYLKGASILLMLQNLLSEDVFKEGIRSYLNDHSYGSTKSDDLWDSMSKYTKDPDVKDPYVKDLDVKELMRTWTTQKGLPLVTVTKKGLNITIQQERYFRSSNSSMQTPDAKYLWHIPLNYHTNSCHIDSFECPTVLILTKEKDTIVLKEDVSWIKFNFDMDGYYVVHYGVEGWKALGEQLQKDHTVFSYKDRANLINNIFGLSGIGKVSLEDVFNLLTYLGKESYTAPITEALFQLDIIHGLVEKQGLFLLSGRVEQYVLRLLNRTIRNQTWTNEGTLSERELRTKLLSFACSHGCETCQSKALELFNEWKESNGTMSLPTDVMKIVFKAGAKTEEGWTTLLNMYRSSMYEAEKTKLLEALASTDDVRKLIWLMQEGLEGDIIRTQELPRLLATISKSVTGHLLSWDFVKEHWDALTEKFQPGSFSIQSIVTRTTAQFSTAAHLQEVQTFFASTKGKSYELNCVKEAIETIQLNIQWMERNLLTLERVL